MSASLVHSRIETRLRSCQALWYYSLSWSFRPDGCELSTARSGYPSTRLLIEPASKPRDYLGPGGYCLKTSCSHQQPHLTLPGIRVKSYLLESWTPTWARDVPSWVKIYHRIHSALCSSSNLVALVCVSMLSTHLDLLKRKSKRSWKSVTLVLLICTTRTSFVRHNWQLFGHFFHTQTNVAGVTRDALNASVASPKGRA